MSSPGQVRALPQLPDFAAEWVEFDKVKPFKLGLLRRAYIRYRDTQPPKLVRQLAAFREENRYWLSDYALFRAIHDAREGQAWYEWPREFALKDPQALLDWMTAVTKRPRKRPMHLFLVRAPRMARILPLSNF